MAYLETEIDLREVLETPHMARPVSFQNTTTRIYVKTDTAAAEAAEWLTKHSTTAPPSCKPCFCEVVSEKSGRKTAIPGIDLIDLETVKDRFPSMKMFKRELVTEYAEGVPEWEK